MTYAPNIVARGLYHYLRQDKPVLRQAHRMLCEELRQKGAKIVPTWRVFGTWAKRGEWAKIKESLVQKVQQATGESLGEWRSRQVKQLNKVIDAAFTQDAVGDAKFLGGKAPGTVLAKLVELADRLQGGGEKLTVEGGGPVTFVVEIVKPGKKAKKKGEQGEDVRDG